MTLRVVAPVMAVLSLAASQPSPERASMRTSADSTIVRRVDHVVISMADPASVFALLADTLGLPVAWPLQSFGTYTSGGVFAGGITVEIGKAEARPGNRLPRVSSFVLEPAPIEQAVAAATERGLNPAPLFEFDDKQPAMPAWRTSTLRALSGSGLGVVLCEYRRPDMSALRIAYADSLRVRHGGRLGVQRAAAVVLGTGGDTLVRGAWSRLLGTSASTITLALGPELRLDDAQPRGAVALVLQVASVDAAEGALRALDVHAQRRHGELVLEAARFGGLEIRLIDR